MSLKSKIKNNKFFSNMFGFESGIDITDDTQVLYRRNIVIKNIIFLSNLVFTIMFAVLSFGEKSNIVLTIILFPVTFLVNMGLKKTINKAPDDLTTQKIASHIASFYMLLLSIVIYVKLKFGSIVYLQECGYILIYYSLLICSFYQNKKLLKLVFEWTLVIVTILHFTVTYGIVFLEMASDLQLFIQNFFVSDAFKDIILRTLLLCIFMLVLYSLVSISDYMQEERKKELTKRRQVQEDFTEVITKIFNVTLDTSPRTPEDKENIIAISKMSRRLAELLNLSIEECDEIEAFARVHIDNEVNFAPSGANEDEKFANLQKQTTLGSSMISRLQLERKCETIMQTAFFEESFNDAFVVKMNSIQNDEFNQTILLSDIYVSMRNVKPYKRPYNHSVTIKYMEDRFRVFFDGNVFERFMRYQAEFEKIYDEI